MPDLWFYHLEQARVEDALPELLLKLQARGGRAVIVSEDEARLKALDGHLWTFREDSFLPHGQAGGDHDAKQPILLSPVPENRNQASMLFCLDGADPGPVDPWERVVVIFEAADDTGLARARALWAAQKKLGTLVSYWRQNEQGRWEKKA